MRADLQRYYGIDLDHAMGGEHTPHHIAELVRFLPKESALVASVDDDSGWNLESTLTAMLLNSLNLLIWGMSDKNRRGAKPEQVLPPSMKKKHSTSLEAQVLTIAELMRSLALERMGNG